MEQHRQHRHDDGEGERRAVGDDRAPAQPLIGAAHEQRRQRERSELGHARQRRHHAAARRRADRQQREHQRGAHEAVVGVGVQGVQREGIGGPAVGQHHAERAALEPAPEQVQAGECEQVEEDGGAVGGRQRVPRTAPAEDQAERDIEEVAHRAIGVPVHVVVGPVAVEGDAVDQLVGADHARVAHVDHVGVEDVEPDAEGHEEHGPHGQPRGGRQRVQRPPRPPAAVGEQQQPDHQVDERRIDQRDGESDLGVVEERQRDREAEQHQDGRRCSQRRSSA